MLLFNNTYILNYNSNLIRKMFYLYFAKNHDGKGNREVVGYNGYVGHLCRNSFMMWFD